uniref:Uncharacterized protein n=2 Tax=Nymphaea colorata TaxID=210225 RepID=A0A5K0W2I8_9MAGN
MDSDNLFRYSLPVSDTRHALASSSSSSFPKWTYGSLKVSFGNSPDSPLSSPFDGDSLSGLSNSQEQYSTPENFSVISPSYKSALEIDSFQRSTNTQRNFQIHSGGSSFSRDAGIGYGLSMRDKLQQLETALMGPDREEVDDQSAVPDANKGPESSKRTREWSGKFAYSLPKVEQDVCTGTKCRRTDQMTQQLNALQNVYLQEAPQGNVKQLLMQCADALWQNNEVQFDRLIAKARTAVSISGDPIQRLGAYMIEGLVARKEASGSNIYRALRCKEPESKDLLSYMHILYEICPYLKFGYMAANGAIAEAFRDEDRVHIIDFQIAQGTQWITLLQALAARPSGPPHVRITGIDDPMSKYARGEGLEAVGRRLAAISEKFKIPVVFHPVPEFSSDIRPEMLNIQPGEALAVNFTFQLHHTPDESVDVNNPRDGLLRMVKSLSPKVTTLVEQESNTNTAPFFARFMETLDYYSAMFESIDVTMPRNNKDRIHVEQHCLARDIVNIIACEGKERVERHELLGKWRSRLSMAGFRPHPLSSYVNSVIRALLRSYSEHYTLLEKDEALLLGWKSRNLVSASAWC